ncbi:hypothetical protein E0L10_06750 [Enterococcus durans]|nr:hypothetical protein [Enterococcus durans]
MCKTEVRTLLLLAMFSPLFYWLLSVELNGLFTTLSTVFKELTFNNKSKNLKIWKAISRFSSLFLRSKRSFHNLILDLFDHTPL